GAIVLMAHYDTVPATPGANDNGTAVATLLEVGRALRAAPSLRNDVILLFTDGEEPAPRFGSTAFVERHPYAAEVRLVINLEAIGGSGASEMIEVVGNEGALISHYAEAVSQPVASSVLDDIVELIGGSNTDISPFRDRGIAGFEFAYLHGSPIYHSPDDDLDSVHRGSLQHHGTHALGLVRHFGDIDLGGLADLHSEVYFTLVGKVVVHYPAWLGVVLIAVAGLMLAGALWLGSSSRRPRPKALAAGTGWMLLLVVGVGIVLGIGWKLLSAALWDRSGPGGLVSSTWLAAMVVVSAGPTVLVYRRLVARLGAGVMEWATVTLWWALGLVTAVTLPGAGYLFVWPVLAAVLVAVFGPARRWIALGLVALPTVVLILPVVDTFFQMGLPRPGNTDSQLPEMALLVGLLVSGAAALLAPLFGHGAGTDRSA
ncbi:MAG: M20/M25/M40 family metallo-hydrolase, partial [Acidimicrobiia bacterium]|nr:M20/M25/M40 family metallo-hydrolase [Acidimicrobiia bacterium]